MSILTQTKRRRALLAVCVAFTFLLNPWIAILFAAPPPKPPKSPNILFIILDDVGIDQMKIFGYGGATPPRTPNIDAIAHAGVRFRNTWSMPECSPSRAMFFEGRYPLRTNIQAFITPVDLANSQLSPFEATTPKLLKKKGYDNALFGKFHLAGPQNNPFDDGTPHALGWDFYYGYLEAAPHPIDQAAGGVTDPNTNPATCGFLPSTEGGACHFSAGTCSEITSAPAKSMPSRICLEQGGIFVPGQTCQSPSPSNLNFTTLNGYYVSPLVINREDGSVEAVSPTDPRSRGYRTTIETNATRDWIKQRNPRKPWMATLSFSSAHAPYQQPPAALVSAESPNSSSFDCTNQVAQRILSNQMIESIDHEIGRLLVELGLAKRTPTGQLDYHPETTNTMVAIIGDNGTYFAGVKEPFIPKKSKGTVYQTGVWVPLIVSGPLVALPDREVRHMVNVADLFQLFGEIAGLDVHKAVPKSHILDSASMLPYLTNPTQGSIRTVNFTQTASNIIATSTVLWPCVLPSVNTCLELFPFKQLCNFEDGKWYGPDSDDPNFPDGLASCCEVNSATGSNYTLLPDSQVATRDDHFKVVQKVIETCPGKKTAVEFYEINELAPLPTLDENDLLGGQGLAGENLLTPEQKQHFQSLRSQMTNILASEPSCPGDGNLDKKVNGKDIQNWKVFSSVPLNENQQNPSWYDFNFDGKTDELDLAIIRQHQGTNCLKQQ